MTESRAPAWSERYEMVVGLEVHVHLKTNTKIFCRCSTAFGDPPIWQYQSDPKWQQSGDSCAADPSVTWSIREGPAAGAIDQSVYPVQYRSPSLEGVFRIVATSNAATGMPHRR